MTKLTMVEGAPKADTAEERKAIDRVRQAWGARARLVRVGQGWEVVYRLGDGDTPFEAFLSAEMDSCVGLTLSLADLHTLRGENVAAEED